MKTNLGFTLVELLIAMAIVGVIFVLILNWQTSTLQISTRANTLADQLSELNDLTGYVGDRVRSAEAVRLNGFSVNGDSCDSTTPCLAVLSLTEDVSGTTVTRTWNRLVFRVEPRSGWTSLDKVNDTWADTAANRIVIVREYRDTCTETAAPPLNCVGVTPALSVATYKDGFLGANLGGMNPQLVADNLTSSDQGGSAIVPFSLQFPSKPLGPGNPVVLTFQSKRNTRGQVTFVPATAPTAMTVQPRNLAP